jgi:hypothetical protein
MRAFFRDRINPLLLRRSGVAPAPRTRWLMGQRAWLLRELEIDTILDVGANVGQYGHEVRSNGFASWAGASSRSPRLCQPTSGVISMHGKPKQESVVTETLQRWLSRHCEVQPERALLKIDVQGSERDVFIRAHLLV